MSACLFHLSSFIHLICYRYLGPWTCWHWMQQSIKSFWATSAAAVIFFSFTIVGTMFTAVHEAEIQPSSCIIQFSTWQGPTAIKHLPTFCTLLHICFFALPPSVCTELRPSSLTSHSQSSASDLSLFRGHSSVLILFSCSATCHVVFTAASLLLTTAYSLL